MPNLETPCNGYSRVARNRQRAIAKSYPVKFKKTGIISLAALAVAATPLNAHAQETATAPTTPETTATTTATTKVTKADVTEAQDKAKGAQAAVDAQKEVVKQDETAVDAANKTVETAETNLDKAKEAAENATPEAIAAAETVRDEKTAELNKVNEALAADTAKRDSLEADKELATLNDAVEDAVIAKEAATQDLMNAAAAASVANNAKPVDVDGAKAKVEAAESDVTAKTTAVTVAETELAKAKESAETPADTAKKALDAAKADMAKATQAMADASEAKDKAQEGLTTALVDVNTDKAAVANPYAKLTAFIDAFENWDEATRDAFMATMNAGWSSKELTAAFEKEAERLYRDGKDTEITKAIAASMAADKVAGVSYSDRTLALIQASRDHKKALKDSAYDDLANDLRKKGIDINKALPNGIDSLTKEEHAEFLKLRAVIYNTFLKPIVDVTGREDTYIVYTDDVIEEALARQAKAKELYATRYDASKTQTENFFRVSHSVHNVLGGKLIGDHDDISVAPTGGTSDNAIGLQHIRTFKDLIDNTIQAARIYLFNDKASYWGHTTNFVGGTKQLNDTDPRKGANRVMFTFAGMMPNGNPNQVLSMNDTYAYTTATGLAKATALNPDAFPQIDKAKVDAVETAYLNRLDAEEALEKASLKLPALRDAIKKAEAAYNQALKDNTSDNGAAIKAAERKLEAAKDALAKAEKALDTAKANLTNAERLEAERLEKIKAADTKLETAKDNLKAAEETLDKAVTARDANESFKQVKTLNEAIDAARTRRDMLLKEVNDATKSVEDLKNASANLEKAELDLAIAKRDAKAALDKLEADVARLKELELANSEAQDEKTRVESEYKRQLSTPLRTNTFVRPTTAPTTATPSRQGISSTADNSPVASATSSGSINLANLVTTRPVVATPVPVSTVSPATSPASSNVLTETTEQVIDVQKITTEVTTRRQTDGGYKAPAASTPVTASQTSSEKFTTQAPVKKTTRTVAAKLSRPSKSQARPKANGGSALFWSQIGMICLGFGAIQLKRRKK